MVVLPPATPVAKPELALMLATEVSEESQATAEVMISVLPSEYVPVAVNCREVPAAIERLDGVTAMDFRVAEVTVTVTAGLVAPPIAAVICTDPVEPPRTRPAPTLAIPELEELQVALEVTSCVVPSLNLPTAVSCTVPFLAIDDVVGAMATD
jgi:hypothetical protein